MKKILVFAIFAAIVLLNQSHTHSSGSKDKLSEYGFFVGNLADMKPAADVVPYALNAPLFSDYAHKARFVRLPNGATVDYNPDSVLQFPVGTAIVKTFYYPKDFRDASKGRRLLETRVLLHEPTGWLALPYIWNEAQTEAMLEFTGDTKTVAWRDEKGNKQVLDYIVPNMNQCKGCHERDGKISPIGPSVRQLNGNFDYGQSVDNQLVNWKIRKILRGVPDDLSHAPMMPNYADKAENIDARARAYLDANCAHCHNRHAPAQTSGLFLEWREKDSTALGFYKTPVAAGRGSGDKKYDIEPKKPNESILVYRMLSTNPGEMMPELSRRLVHTEGVELVKDWIKQMR
jgi:uncharacterized repeat protein (TIGR03806 family)